MIWGKILMELQAGRPLALLTIIAARGSTPRGLGSHQLVLADGSTLGTVGGGYQEYLATLAGKRCLQEKKSAFRQLFLHPNEKEDIDAACGGELTVFCQYLDPGNKNLPAFFSRLLEIKKKRQRSWLVWDLAVPENWGLALVTEEKAYAVNWPRKESVSALWCQQNVAGLDQSSHCYSEPLTYPGLVYIFGGGHVAQALVPVLTALDFSCIVLDDRADFAVPARFPGAKAVQQVDYRDLAQLTIGPADYVCIMTRGHVGDYDVQKAILPRHPYYLGVMGSRRKLALARQKLLHDGFTAAAIDACHAPIGLAISAVTPAEIAISIAAELIAVRAKREGREKSHYKK